MALRDVLDLSGGLSHNALRIAHARDRENDVRGSSSKPQSPVKVVSFLDRRSKINRATDPFEVVN
eukprot:8479054-Pyramimonas_sp.AAC.1